MAALKGRRGLLLLLLTSNMMRRSTYSRPSAFPGQSQGTRPPAGRLLLYFAGIASPHRVCHREPKGNHTPSSVEWYVFLGSLLYELLYNIS